MTGEALLFPRISLRSCRGPHRARRWMPPRAETGRPHARRDRGIKRPAGDYRVARDAGARPVSGESEGQHRAAAERDLERVLRRESIR